MAIYEKVREYLDTHTTPVTTADLAKRFLVGRDSIGRALKRLEEEGFAKYTLIGAKRCWLAAKAIRPEQPVRHVAIPKDIRPIIQPARIRTSYPHIRGYDD